VEAVIANRVQFAFTIMFHYLFPIVTMGLAPFIAFFQLRAARRNDPADDAAARFWTRVLAINVAAGVVTGIPMEFQFGTNWAAFSARAGSVVGQSLAMEGLFAFFTESVFLGALLYGRGRLPPILHAISAFVVWFGAWLSGFFIIVTDAWMQHPVGYTVAHDGTINLTDMGAVLLSPFAWWQFWHAIMGALLAGGFIVAAVGAFYLLARRDQPVATRCVRSGIVVAFAASVLAVFPTGDRNGANVTAYQPAKLAALEGLFHTQRGAPLAIIGMPDTQNQRLIDPIEVPDVLSFLAYGNFNAKVQGLDAYRSSDLPPVTITYYAYHIMVGLATFFGGITALGVLLLWLRRLERTRWFLWIVMLTLPFPLIANEAGWASAEVGRQPWIIYGLMRTAEGASTNVVAAETIFTLVGFAGIYAFLILLYVFLVLREVLNGPSPAPEMNASSATRGVEAPA
jgi:cytochrome bd ubiquinol oxidase subunit I